MRILSRVAGLAATVLLLYIGFAVSAQSGTGSISGTITGGTLPGSSAEPTVITGGVVEIYEASLENYLGTVLTSVAANPNGTFEVSGLAPGLYKVLATAEGYVREYYKERFRYYDAPVITVSAGVVTGGIDIELDPAMTLSGRVTAMDGVTPLENIAISFVAETYEFNYVCTDENGQYTITNAPTNAVFRVIAAFIPPSIDPSLCNGFIQFYYKEYDNLQGERYFYYRPDMSSVIGEDFRLVAGGRIAGRVTLEDGITPVSNPSVLIYPSDSDPNIFPPGFYALTGDEKGNFLSPILPPDTDYRVRFSNLDRFSEGFYGGSDFASAAPVTVVAGSVTGGIDFHPVMHTGTGSISGNVYAPDGITALGETTIFVYEGYNNIFEVAITDQNGYFFVGELPFGTYYLSAHHPQYQLEYYDNHPGDLFSSTPIHVTGEVPSIDVVLDGVSTLSGTIFDQLTGLPLANNAQLRLADIHDHNRYLVTTTDLQGNYQVNFPATGNYNIFISAGSANGSDVYRNPPNSETPTPLIINTDDIINLDFTLPRTAEILGTVYTDGSSTACAGVHIESSHYLSALSNRQYLTTIPLLENYIVWAGDATGFGCDKPDINYVTEYWREAPTQDTATPIMLDYHQRVRDGIDFTLVQPGTPVTMNGGVTLQGRPTSPNENWITPLHIVITPTGGGAAVYDQTIQTDESGAFTVSGLDPGRYVVWVKGETTLATEQIVTLAAGPTEVKFGMLQTGDADGSNSITLPDFSILANTFGKLSGEAGYDARADFNGDGAVTIIDFSLLASNFGQSGASP